VKTINMMANSEVSK